MRNVDERPPLLALPVRGIRSGGKHRIQAIFPNDDAVFGGLHIGRIGNQFQIFLHVQNGGVIVPLLVGQWSKRA